MSLEKSEEGASVDKRTLTSIILDGKKYRCSRYKDGCTCQLLLCNNQSNCNNQERSCGLKGNGGKSLKSAQTGTDCDCEPNDK